MQHVYLYCILISNEFNYNYSTKLPKDVLVTRTSQRTITYGFFDIHSRGRIIKSFTYKLIINTLYVTNDTEKGEVKILEDRIIWF